MAQTRSPGVGPTARPVAIPDDLQDPARHVTQGVIDLPAHISWSGRTRYDLTDRQDRISAYEQVLTEGTEADIRRFIEVEVLVEQWDEMVLSPHVRAAWEAWLRQRRLLD